jgi:hypothetical protein
MYLAFILCLMDECYVCSNVARSIVVLASEAHHFSMCVLFMSSKGLFTTLPGAASLHVADVFATQQPCILYAIDTLVDESWHNVCQAHDTQVIACKLHLWLVLQHILQT